MQRSTYPHAGVQYLAVNVGYFVHGLLAMSLTHGFCTNRRDWVVGGWGVS